MVFYRAGNERRWRIVSQEADERVAAPPSLNGLVGLSCERVLIVQGGQRGPGQPL
jgi:hypothetical protein